MKWFLQTNESHVLQRGALHGLNKAQIKLMKLIHVLDMMLYALFFFVSNQFNETRFGFPLETAPQTLSEHRDGHR